MSKRFFRSNRPGYLHPVCSELESSGIRVAVGDYIVTEGRYYKQNEDGRTAPDVRGHSFVPLSHLENVVLEIGLQQEVVLSFAYIFHTHTPRAYKRADDYVLCTVAFDLAGPQSLDTKQ